MKIKNLGKMIIGITAAIALIVAVILVPQPLRGVEYYMAVTPMIEIFDAGGVSIAGASGVWVDANHVLTAKHVIEPPAEGWKIYSGNDVFIVIAVEADPNHDVAYLTIEGKYKGPVARLDSRHKLARGDVVTVAGWMLRLGMEVTNGQIANPASDSNYWGEGDCVAAIACTYGASGGPVFHDGYVVGIVSRGMEGFLVFEPITYFWRK